MTHRKESHHNFYKITEHLNGKHFLYAGLATTTLIGGLGVTPYALAETESNTPTELVTKKGNKKNKTQRIETPWQSAGDNIEFTADDFIVKHGVIVDVSDSFLDKIGYWSYDDPTWNGILTFPDEFATTITGIGTGALSGLYLTQVDLNSLKALETIGDEAFESSYTLETIDISNLENLKSIGEYAFSGCGYLSVLILNNLPSLQTIGEAAFEGSFYQGYMENLKYSGTATLTDLPALTTIGDGAFQYCEGLTDVTFSGLPLVSSIPQNTFDDCPNLKTVTFDGLGSSEKPNSVESLPSGLFSGCEMLTTVTINNLPNLNSIEESVFDSTDLQTLTLTNLPRLSNIGTYIYAPASFDHALNQLIVGNLSPSLTVDNRAFEYPQPAGIVIPFNGEADVATAQKFLGSINSIVNDNHFTGSNKWALGGSITYKYIDQKEQVIKTGADHEPVKAFTLSGKVDTEYDLPSIPTIAGYGKPTLFSGTETGTIPLGMQEIVYQYQGKATSFTIYRVDTSDKNLVTPETVTGFTNDVLDLDDKQLGINGYDFQELNSSAPITRAVGAFTWQSAADSVGKKLTLGENAGRSYKFVYAKTAAPKADDSSSTSSSNNTTNNTNNTDNTNNNANTSSTSTSAASSSSANTPVPATSSSATDSVTPPSSSTNQEPGGLPSTGGNATDSSNSTGGTNNTSRTNTSSNTRYVPLSSDTGLNSSNSMYAYDDGEDESLPQSGITVNRVLPVLGAIALAGVIGLYAFSKKRKG